MSDHTILDTAQRFAKAWGVPLVFDATVEPGIITVYTNVPGHVDAVRVHPDAGSFDPAWNGGQFANYRGGRAVGAKS